MTFIEFYSTKIKPALSRNKKMWNPIETGRLNEDILVIRDKDVNAFLICGDTGYVAIDCGYRNSEAMKEGLKKLRIEPKLVHTLFFTHLDVAHAGGAHKESTHIYPSADMYVGEHEMRYILDHFQRKVIGPLKLVHPMRLVSPKIYEENRTYKMDGVRVQVIPMYGHTHGHCAFLVNRKYLFTGDAIISDGTSGYCFYDKWNVDSKVSKMYLSKAKELLSQSDIELVITSHSGALSFDAAFANVDKFPMPKAGGYIPDAPSDVYK